MEKINKNGNRCVIYARYSCQNQTEQSIEGQIYDCEKYAKRNGLVIINQYIDRALSGTSDNRAAFQQMIKDSRKGLFDVILVWKLDRFARNKYDSAMYKHNLKANGVRVLSAMENIPDTPEGVLMESVLEGFAEYFSLDLAQKVMRGMKETAKKHKVTGKLPFCYTKSEEGTYIPDPKTAPAVKKIFEMYFAGESKQDIALYLNNHGYRTAYGNSFTKNAITPLVQNTRYIGKYHYSDMELIDENQRIISDELFYSVQRKVKANQHSGAMTRARERFLLTGKLYCGYCKEKIHDESARSQGGSMHYYYTCKGYKKEHTCDSRSRYRKEELEKSVLDNIMQLINNSDLVNRLADAIMQRQSASNTHSESIAALEYQLSDTKKRIKNLMNAIESGIFTPTTQARLSELETLSGRLEFEIAEKRADSNKFSKSQILDFFKRLELYADGPWQTKQTLIQLLIKKIYLWEDRILIIYNFSSKTNDTDFDIDIEINNIIKALDKPGLRKKLCR